MGEDTSEVREDDVDVRLPIRVQECSDLVEDNLRGKMRFLEDDVLIDAEGYRRFEDLG